MHFIFLRFVKEILLPVLIKIGVFLECCHYILQLRNYNFYFSTGKSVEDNGNRFIGHATTAVFYKQIRKTIVEVMRKEGVPSATHNVYTYRFQGQDGTIHEGSDDDGEYGAGRHLLKSLTDHEINNVLVIVSRWFSGNKLGPRRFTHISEVGLSAAKNLQTTV